MGNIPKIIALFNHKGGVSKTTTAFHIGHKFAQRGKNVLLVDADSQCNLTCLVNGIATHAKNPNFEEINSQLEKFYHKYSNIYSAIKDFLNTEVLDLSIENVKLYQHNKNYCGNLYLLPGSISFAEAEQTFMTAVDKAQSKYNQMVIFKKIPGVFRRLFVLLAEKYKIDYVFIDMSPSVGLLNRCILMNADYFIIPSAPDFFSVQAIESLSTVLPTSYNEFSIFRDGSNLNGYKLPGQPRFLGCIMQKYRLKSGRPFKNKPKDEMHTLPTISFSHWIERLNNAVKNTLYLKLKTAYMICDGDHNYFSINVPEFNSLIAQSQKTGIPVFGLNIENKDDNKNKQRTKTISKIKQFDQIFDHIADEIEKRISLS